ncbi:MAG TPA: DUF1828 domain-containing protein [Candidatus Tetragenococcus pullicola]|nr:DUF1828 domain-containing protein [Candidatus Tetragenococcus pullicola]
MHDKQKALEMQDLMNSMLEFYKTNVTIKQLKQASEIVTPFTNHLNDRIAIYVELTKDGQIKLSDDGVTLDELSMMGLDYKTITRNKILMDILKNYQLYLENETIYTVAKSKSQFPQKKLNLIQGLLSVYDMLFTIKENTVGIFQEEVFDFFFENDFGGTEKPKLTGASGIIHSVDYSLGATKKRPQTLFKLLNNPTFSDVAAQQYISDDLKKGLHKPKISVRYVIIGNDTKNKIPVNSLIASNDMNIDLIPWSQKEEILSLK